MPTGRRGHWVVDLVVSVPLLVAALPALVVAAIYDNVVGFIPDSSASPFWGYVLFVIGGVFAFWALRSILVDR